MRMRVQKNKLVAALHCTNHSARVCRDSEIKNSLQFLHSFSHSQVKKKGVGEFGIDRSGYLFRMSRLFYSDFSVKNLSRSHPHRMRVNSSKTL